jgi:deazaflavin-dependent oxidoreductase (nitroreductase family)
MTTDTTSNPETETPEWDPAAVQAFEEGLIADLRANGGRATQGPMAGRALLVMYSTGAKSGLQRRSILTPSRDGDDYVVAGTASGRPKDPAWIANVGVNPDVTVEADGERFEATAAIADGDERDRLWDQHVAQLPWFADYPAQVGGRTIPMVRLTRRLA